MLRRENSLLLLAEMILDQLLERSNHLCRIRAIGANTNFVALASSDVEQANRRNGNLFRLGAAQVLDGHFALELANFVDKIFRRARVQSVFIIDSEDDIDHRRSSDGRYLMLVA